MKRNLLLRDELKRLFSSSGKRFLAMKDGLFLFSSEERGISPLYFFLKTFGERCEGAYVADTVIGRGAAHLLIKARAAYLYAGLISQGAAALLERAGLPFEYKEKVPCILNRAKEGPCPVERLTEGVTDTQTAFDAIEEFVMNLKKGEGVL